MFGNIGYRKRKGGGGNESDQRYRSGEGAPFSSYQLSNGDNDNNGGGLFARAGVTLHLTDADDLSLTGDTSKNKSQTPNIK